MDYLEANPGRWGYLLSRFFAVTGLASLLGGAAFCAYLFINRPSASSLKQISLSGKTDVTLDRAGTYNFYYEAGWTEPPRGRQLMVKFKQTGEEVAVNDDSSFRQPAQDDFDGHIKFATFSAREPGDYEITVAGSPTRVMLAGLYLGAEKRVDYWLGWAALIGGVALLIIGRVAAFVTYALRKRAVEASGERLVYAEKGISVYDNVIFLKKGYSATELHKSQINYVQQTSELVKGHRAGMAHVLQGVKINYTRSGRERMRTFWSRSYSTLYHAIKRAGYRTRWEPPAVA
ncbi:MAG TPA: hypothetical protein VJT09_03080 [Pyrinomonadaceae bacterium]|nr:hypothetical protein [Pyrinomonadaceae bacterium]